MDELLSNGPDDWNINNFLYFACIAGHSNQANKLLDKMIVEPIMPAWRDATLFEDRKYFANGMNQDAESEHPIWHRTASIFGNRRRTLAELMADRPARRRGPCGFESNVAYAEKLCTEREAIYVRPLEQTVELTHPFGRLVVRRAPTCGLDWRIRSPVIRWPTRSKRPSFLTIEVDQLARTGALISTHRSRPLKTLHAPTARPVSRPG